MLPVIVFSSMNGRISDEHFSPLGLNAYGSDVEVNEMISCIHNVTIFRLKQLLIIMLAGVLMINFSLQNFIHLYVGVYTI